MPIRTVRYNEQGTITSETQTPMPLDRAMVLVSHLMATADDVRLGYCHLVFKDGKSTTIVMVEELPETFKV